MALNKEVLLLISQEKFISDILQGFNEVESEKKQMLKRLKRKRLKHLQNIMFLRKENELFASCLFNSKMGKKCWTLVSVKYFIYHYFMKSYV